MVSVTFSAGSAIFPFNSSSQSTQPTYKSSFLHFSKRAPQESTTQITTAMSALEIPETDRQGSGVKVLEDREKNALHLPLCLRARPHTLLACLGDLH